jgi:tetratricopeptide (TPR) repeat protein
VARKGARELGPKPGSASAEFRKAAREATDRDRGQPAAYEPDTWVDAGPVRKAASRAVGRGTAAAPSTARRPPRQRSRPVAPDVAAEVGAAAGARWAGRMQDRLAEAAKAYQAERYRDARKLLENVLERAPGNLAVRELYGLTLYRLGRWRDAIRELGAVETLGGSVDHHPVIADAHRALGHHDEVARLWDELRRGGAGVDTLIEGRIVAAGSLADTGRVQDAVRLLEQGPVNVKRPHEHHLRLWYALAALYERAGDPVRARGLFGRLVAVAPGFGDASERLAALGG